VILYIKARKHTMFTMLWTILITVVLAGASAQNGTPKDKPASDGTTYMSDHLKHIEQQPQGRTGPLDTTTGGAPAESPQGQSPPGMQAAPEGSSKSIVDKKR
jgi:hypothetical protein